MTPKQREVYDFVDTYWNQYGFAPTFEAIAMGCGITSKSAVHRIVNEMVQRRLVDYTPRLRRTIRCLPLGTDEFQRGYAMGFQDGSQSATPPPEVVSVPSPRNEGQSNG